MSEDLNPVVPIEEQPVATEPETTPENTENTEVTETVENAESKENDGKTDFSNKGLKEIVDTFKDLIEGDMFANKEFRDKVHTEMDIVAHAYETFKKVQLEQNADLETFRKAKAQLKERLDLVLD